ncbi:Guanine nucleotide-binding protein alpha-1 subunit [Durusdinium trenchii]|uniref:Guanine nucleotide-binding protein alpha-1 subunit n=1 Tax=Durusdinium trenchii TaxID=1381693 RepID=A0ABP0J7A7_9DINO
MGACGSSMSAEEKAELARSKALEAEQRKQMMAEANKLKLLLLGAGESGKSTLFKQMKILFSEQHGFTQAELQTAVKVVYNNVFSNMKVLLQNCESFTPAEDAELADTVLSMDDGTPIDGKVAEQLKAIWSDPGVQATWEERSSFQVQDALEYFMDNIDRIAEAGYLPSNQDILRSRVRTSGIVEAEYNIGGAVVAMFDVGGQRNERKKWIHCFDNVTAVIFVAAISEYDQVLYEDQTMNRQEEALNLFREMCTSTWFKDKSMILFLNKRDVFRKKLQYVPFRVDDGDAPRNTDYNGPVAVPGTPSAQDGTPEFEEVYNATTAYLIDLYKKYGKGSSSQREIYVKVTCATDSDQVKVVMESCKDIVLKSNLSENGFL